MWCGSTTLRKIRFGLTAFLLGTTIFLVLTGVNATKAQDKRRFTVADDIGLTRFSSTDAVTFSPDGRYFVVLSERGRLDLNRPESLLRFYVTEDVHLFLSRPNASGGLSAYWTVSKSTYKDGPIVTELRWLADSSGVAFLAKIATGIDQLFFADLRAKTVQPLTSEDQSVRAFDVRTKSKFVYCVSSPAIRRKAVEDVQAPAIVGTARSLDSLIFPEESPNPSVWIADLSDLWAVLDGRRFRVADAESGHAIPIHLEGQRALALSPDGRSVVTALTVKDVPQEWETLYVPPFSTSPYRIRAGKQNPNGFSGQRDVNEYVLIDLASGKTKRLTDAPIGNAAGWWARTRAAWSSNGQLIILSDAFLPAASQRSAQPLNAPCVAVVDLMTSSLSCLERLKPRPTAKNEGGWPFVYDVHLGPGKGVATVQYLAVDGTPASEATYVQVGDGSWNADLTHDAASNRASVNVFVKQSLNEPPVLMATDRSNNTSRVVWDPNPQLKGIEMGELSVFKWKDMTGRNWVGGLYKPPDYVQGKRYPLVIQTHGFDEQEFRPSGAFPTAFAAQELAAVGFLVLQVRDCPIRTTPEEGSCQVAGYEAAVKRLAADGLVDSDHVGLIGFSRTCYYVLEALTTSTLHFGAASITDGVNEGYLQYITGVDSSGNSIAHEADAMIQAQPFGPGLQQWLKLSPEFNMDKVNTPLQIVALGRRSVISMWEPYANLRYLKKPVDLVVLNSDEHILTNPTSRMISQAGTVDWLRFWLQDYEDPDPAKSERYKTWEAMRASQDLDKNAKSRGTSTP